MPVNIATACGRSDLFALYGNSWDGVQLPVVGFDDRGHALVVTTSGQVVLATKGSTVDGPFHSVVSTYRED